MTWSEWRNSDRKKFLIALRNNFLSTIKKTKSSFFWWCVEFFHIVTHKTYFEPCNGLDDGERGWHWSLLYAKAHSSFIQALYKYPAAFFSVSFHNFATNKRENLRFHSSSYTRSPQFYALCLLCAKKMWKLSMIKTHIFTFIKEHISHSSFATRWN